MDVAETPASCESVEGALTRGRESLDAGDIAGAWTIYAKALRSFPNEERLLLAAADTWVAAVDQARLDDFPADERREIEALLIEQRDCSVSPPVFHHRIAAQHSSGLKGHLKRAASALEPVLVRLAEDGPSLNVVLMLLLLRSKLAGVGQARISELHRQQFKQFSVGDLAIPYSVMFHRADFSANAQDLGRLAAEEREKILAGDWPLTHVLLALWLAPHAFRDLPPGWSALAVGNRLTETSDEEEVKSARSLALRLNGEAHRRLSREGLYGNAAAFTDALNALATERARLEGGSARSAHEKRLERTLHQAINAGWNKAAVAAPMLGRLRRKPKAAICVSGQLRGFRQSLETWKRSLLPALDATIFVSSWSRIGRAGAEPFRYVLPFEGSRFQHEYRAIGTEIGLPEMQERYPSLFAELDRSGFVEKDELSRIYDTPHVHLDDDSNQPFDSFTNPEKMHFKIEQCFHMAEASGEEFDLVIRIRPDKPVEILALDWRDLVGATRGQALLYSETPMGVHFGALEIGDQFAVGGMDASRIYHETWSRAPRLAAFGLRMFHPEFTGHVSLAQICWLHGIEVRKAPIRFGKLQDPEALGADAIRIALLADAAARGDSMDRRLIAANEQDLRA